jgi:hypothetical protein
MIGEAVSESVRRYRAIASLCRQAAAFRPVQKFSLLQQAEDWERLALVEFEAYVSRCNDVAVAVEVLDEPADQQIGARWWLPKREGLFANLEG